MYMHTLDHRSQFNFYISIIALESVARAGCRQEASNAPSTLCRKRSFPFCGCAARPHFYYRPHQLHLTIYDSIATRSLYTMATTATTCHLFRLPRELRDNIYDLVFTTEHENATVDFAVARSAAPSIRCLHQEAEERYQKSYTEFWSSNIFVLPLDLNYEACRITAKNIHYMKRIRMRTVDAQRRHTVGTPRLYPGLDLEATNDDPLNWTVAQANVERQLCRDSTGFMRWMKLMSRLTLKSCNREEDLKKRRLDEIITALCRLEAAKSKDESRIVY
jgi:hypothetical protein